MWHRGSRITEMPAIYNKDSKGLDESKMMSVLQDTSKPRFSVRINQNPTLHQYALVCDLHAQAGR